MKYLSILTHIWVFLLFGGLVVAQSGLGVRKYEEAEAARKARNYEEAIRLYDDAIALEDTNARFYSSKAWCLILMKDTSLYDQAIKAHEKALRYDSSRVSSYVSLAEIYGEKKDCDRALKWMALAAEKDITRKARYEFCKDSCYYGTPALGDTTHRKVSVMPNRRSLKYKIGCGAHVPCCQDTIESYDACVCSADSVVCIFQQRSRFRFEFSDSITKPEQAALVRRFSPAELILRPEVRCFHSGDVKRSVWRQRFIVLQKQWRFSEREGFVWKRDSELGYNPHAISYLVPFHCNSLESIVTQIDRLTPDPYVVTSIVENYEDGPSPVRYEFFPVDSILNNPRVQLMFEKIHPKRSFIGFGSNIYDHIVVIGAARIPKFTFDPVTMTVTLVIENIRRKALKSIIVLPAGCRDESCLQRFVYKKKTGVFRYPIKGW